jgi:glycosyltransferase involved in cell wall biosynthesis
VIKCLSYGGAESLLVDTVIAADPDRFDYEVAYVLRGQDALVPAISASGTPVYALGAAHDADLRWMIALRRLLSKGHYDIVHFHLPYAAALGQLVVASLPPSIRPGVVYTEHTMWDRDPPSRRQRVLIRALLRASIQRGERLVAVSEASHDALPAPLRHRATTVVHAVDLSETDSLLARRSELRALVRSELGIGTDELLFITVANLRRTKGYDVLLNAVKSVEDCGLPIRFVAVGYGPMRDALQAQHAELALGDRFQFLGQRDDVLRLLAGADAFVLPSTIEGLGVALMEATSMALPIVATSVGGVPEILEDEVDALLIPPGESAPLFEAMRRLATDPELRVRLGREAKRGSSQFDMENVSRAIGDIYEQAVRLP